jgi:hypothetical protein
MVSKKWVWALLLLAAAAIPSVCAENESADWFGAPARYTWDLSMAGACDYSSQCLLHLLGNNSFDGDTARYFKYPDNPKLWPRCVNDSQYVLDYWCDNGNWTTRTKFLALYLLQLADSNSPSTFTLYCDSYRQALNSFEYSIPPVEQYLGEECMIEQTKVPCINSMCVLRTPGYVAFGTTVNVPINDPAFSFLIPLNRTPSFCDAVKPEENFTKCLAGDYVWYNPQLKSVAWVPAGGFAMPTSDTKAKIINPMLSMSSYAMNVLHNENNKGMNFMYFKKTRLFNHIYVAQNGPRAIFGFLEAGLRPEYSILPEETTEAIPMDYIGVRYSGIQLDDTNNMTCLNIIKKYDTKAFCENQTDTGFNVIARHRCPVGAEPEECPPMGSSPIVGVWPALTGKLRP